MQYGPGDSEDFDPSCKGFFTLQPEIPLNIITQKIGGQHVPRDFEDVNPSCKGAFTL